MFARLSILFRFALVYGGAMSLGQKLVRSFCASLGLHYLCHSFIIEKDMKHSYIKLILTIILMGMLAMVAISQDVNTRLMNMLPEIPAEITQPMQRAEYLAECYWDKFDFGDEDALAKDDFLERGFVDYLEILFILSNSATESSVNKLMTKAEGETVFSTVLRLSEKYLYEPASPMSNEEILIPFLKYALQSTALDETAKIRPAFLLENVLKNRIGSIANDFVYTLTNEQTGTLHAINADYTLLYFNEPGCEDCHALTMQLAASPLIKQLTAQEKLSILTVYTNDDIEAWRENSHIMPDSWLYSRDAEMKINFEGIYNIKEFPTMYLLGKDKTVVLKDTTFDHLEHYLGASQTTKD